MHAYHADSLQSSSVLEYLRQGTLLLLGPWPSGLTQPLSLQRRGGGGEGAPEGPALNHAYQKPLAPGFKRAVARFEIPKYDNSSKVFDDLDSHARGRMNTKTGTTWAAQKPDVSRFLHRASLIGVGPDKKFDGGYGELGEILAKHGRHVYRPVIDAMQATPNSSPASQATYLDAFIAVCTATMEGRGPARPDDAVDLISLVKNTSCVAPAETRLRPQKP